MVDQYHEALGYGIRGIPTFVIDNLLFTGAQPYEVFQRVMDKALKTGNPAKREAFAMTTPTIAAPAPSTVSAESPTRPAETGIPSAPTRRRFTVAEYYAMAEAGVFHPEERV